jgi:hypothetical protein
MCYNKERSFQTVIGPETLGENGSEEYFKLDKLIRGVFGRELKAYVDAEVTAEGNLAIYTDSLKKMAW